MNWFCYLLISNDKKRTYIGSTINIKRRLRQHNGEIVGGAKATRTGRPWSIICYVSGFDKTHALCCEWRLKRRKAKYSNKLVCFSGIQNKIDNLYFVLQLEKFTKKCSLSNNLCLIIHWLKEGYKQDLVLPPYITQQLEYVKKIEDINKIKEIEDVNTKEKNVLK